MKHLALLTVASLWMICHTQAALLIYKGTDKVNYLGPDRNQTLTWNVFLVVDYDTGNVGTISYLNFNRVKHYTSSTTTNLHFTVVTGSKGETYTAISHPLSQCALDEGFTIESALVQGANKTLAVDTNKTTLSFPQTLSGDSHGCSASDARVVNINRVVSFDKTNTLKSNNSNETLDDAVARLTAYVEQLGYTRSSAKSAKTRDDSEFHIETATDP